MQTLAAWIAVALYSAAILITALALWILAGTIAADVVGL